MNHDGGGPACQLGSLTWCENTVATLYRGGYVQENMKIGLVHKGVGLLHHGVQQLVSTVQSLQCRTTMR